MPPDPRPDDPRFPPASSGGLDDWEFWGPAADDGDRLALVDLVNRVLDKGVVITGEVTISLAGVDLVYLGLNAVLTSVSTARETLGRDLGRGLGADPGRSREG